MAPLRLASPRRTSCSLPRPEAVQVGQPSLPDRLPARLTSPCCRLSHPASPMGAPGAACCRHLLNVLSSFASSMDAHHITHVALLAQHSQQVAGGTIAAPTSAIPCRTCAIALRRGLFHPDPLPDCQHVRLLFPAMPCR